MRSLYLKINKFKRFICLFYFAMAVLLYRLEMGDLLTFWVLTFGFVLLLSRSLVVSVFASVVAAIVFFVLYAYFSLPPVDSNSRDHFLAGLKAGAHRGLLLDAPENTMAAFRLSKELHADAIEFDLDFTSDGVAVLLHDNTVDRTTNGSGRIGEMTWEQVVRLNAAAKFQGAGKKFDNEKIPTLEETIRLGLQLKFKMFIDVKNANRDLVVPTITQLYRKYPEMYSTTAVCSFFPQVVYWVKRADPNIITGHTWGQGFYVYRERDRALARGSPLSWYREAINDVLERVYIWSLHNWIWKWTGVNLILARYDAITKQYIQMWGDRNIQVVAWTVNDLDDKKLFLQTLQCPFLTDQLSDMQDELVKAP